MPELPIVALPGFFGRAEIFEPFERVCGRHVTALPLPPGGPSEAARLLGPAVRALGAVHLLCGSYGALVAACLDAPAVRSMALVGAVPDRSFIPRRARLLAAALGLAPAGLVGLVYGRRLRERLAAAGVPEPLAQRLLNPPLAGDVVVERLRGVARWDVSPWPDLPMLWLLGEDDPEVRWGEREVLASVPGAQVVSVPGGHRPYASHPAELADRLEAWWQRHDAVARPSGLS